MLKFSSWGLSYLECIFFSLGDQPLMSKPLLLKGQPSTRTEVQDLKRPSSLPPIISLVQFSSVAQHARPPCPSPTPRVHSDSCPSSQWCHQPSHPLLSPLPPVPNPSQHQSLFQGVNFLHEVAKVLEFQPQHHSFQRTPGLISFRMDWLALLAVQGTLKSLLQHHSSKPINSSVLSLLHSPTLTSIQDHWKNHSLD